MITETIYFTHIFQTLNIARELVNEFPSPRKKNCRTDDSYWDTTLIHTIADGHSYKEYKFYQTYNSEGKIKQEWRGILANSIRFPKSFL